MSISKNQIFKIDHATLNNNIKLLANKVGKVQLCILLDITNSMENYILACKTTIVSILNKTKKLFANTEIAIVGFRDKINGQYQIVTQDFTVNADSISWDKFTNLIANDDQCEDIPTAMKRSLQLKWDNYSLCKLCILLTDSPTHGEKYSDIQAKGFFNKMYPGYNWDLYPNDDKLEKNLEHFVKKFYKNGINLFLINLNKRTSRMNCIIKEIYENENNNKILRNAPLICQISDEKIVNKDAKSIENFFLSYFENNIIDSVCDTIQHGNYTIVEEKVNLTDISIDTTQSIYFEENGGEKEKTSIYIDEKLLCKKWTYYYEYAYTKDLIFKLENFKIKKVEDINNGNYHKFFITHPCIGTGTFRCANLLVGCDSEDQCVPEQKYICKTYKDKKLGNNLEFVESVQKIYLLTKLFFEHFKTHLKLKGINVAVNYIYSDIIKFLEKDENKQFDTNDYIHLEKCLSLKDYVKYTNNSLYSSSSNSDPNIIAQAFSHYSYIYSNGEFVVVDIQGDTKYFTDPLINTLNQIFPVELDRGPRGVIEFCISHKCNNLCKLLKLDENAIIFNRNSN